MWDKLGSCPNDFKNHTTTVIFLKNGLKSNFWTNFTKDFPVKNEEHFYLRFSRKIEGEFWIFTRDFPGNFFVPKNFLNGLSSIETGIECWAIPAIDLLPPCLWWSEKWKSEKWKSEKWKSEKWKWKWKGGAGGKLIFQRKSAFDHTWVEGEGPSRNRDSSRSRFVGREPAPGPRCSPRCPGHRENLTISFS